MNSNNLAIVAIVLGLVIVGSEVVLKKAQSQNWAPDGGKIDITVPDAGKSGVPKKDKEINSDESETPELSPDEIKPEPPKDNRRKILGPRQPYKQPYSQPYGRPYGQRSGCP